MTRCEARQGTETEDPRVTFGSVKVLKSIKKQVHTIAVLIFIFPHQRIFKAYTLFFQLFPVTLLTSHSFRFAIIQNAVLQAHPQVRFCGICHCGTYLYADQPHPVSLEGMKLTDESLAADLDVKVDAAPVVGFISKAGSTVTGAASDIKLAIPHVVKRDLPDVGAAVDGVEDLVEGVVGGLPGGSAVNSLLKSLPVGSTISGVQSAVEGVASTVPGVSTVEGAVSGPLSSVVGAVSSTGVLNTATSVVDSTTGTLSSVEGSLPVRRALPVVGSTLDTVEPTVELVGSEVKNVPAVGGLLPVRRALPVVGSTLSTVEPTVDLALSKVQDVPAVGGVVNKAQTVARDVLPAGVLTQLGGLPVVGSALSTVEPTVEMATSKLESLPVVGSVVDEAQTVARDVLPAGVLTQLGGLPVVGSVLSTVEPTVDMVASKLESLPVVGSVVDGVTNIAKRIVSAANGPVDTVLDTVEPKVDAVVPTATGALDTVLPIAGSKVNSVVSVADGVVA